MSEAMHRIWWAAGRVIWLKDGGGCGGGEAAGEREMMGGGVLRWERNAACSNVRVPMIVSTCLWFMRSSAA